VRKPKINRRPLKKPRQLTRVLWAQGSKREPTRKPYNRAAAKLADGRNEA
jgi:hypothetical protein